MRRSFLAICGLVASAVAQAAPATPGRVVSLNLCTDQLLLWLARPDQIASLSPLARDASLSFLAGEAARFPPNAGRGEAILIGGADLVLAGPFDGGARLAMLRRFELPVMTLGLWTSLAQGREQVMALGRALGNPDRAAELVARMDAALARAKDAAPARRSVLVLQRRGYTSGETSILDELLRHMGLEPHAAALGLPSGGVVPLERLIAAPPDYLLMAASDAAAVDQGSALLRHPALAQAVPPERRLVLPDRLTICGGPSTPEAIDALADEIRRKVR